MVHRVVVPFLFLDLLITRALEYSTFDDASSSSVYSLRLAEGQPAFAALQATSPGNGYWCSSGGHSPQEVVSWTGLVNARHKAYGLKLDWAYSPAEFKVLASSDNANFIEAACWRSTLRGDAAFIENVMFDNPLSVRAVTLVMRHPRAWGYFGLNRALLIAAPAPSMIVSGMTHMEGELCVVSSNTGGQAFLSPCLSALRMGSSEGVFVLSEAGELATASNPERCLAVADGNTIDGGRLVLESCRTAAEAEDGRATFEVTAAGQIKLAKLGDYCLSVKGNPAERDVAPHSDVKATSTQEGHSAGAATDGSHVSYWASRNSNADEGHVDLVLNFAEGEVNVASIEIVWVFPAKNFEISIANGGAFSTLYETAVNSLNKTALVIEGEAAKALRIRMREPHPIWGAFGEHFAYGIKSVRVLASSANLVIEDCGEASGHNDARDRFFTAVVPELAVATAANAAAVAETATNAGNRLAGLLAQLAVSVPLLDSCDLARRSACAGRKCNGTMPSPSVFALLPDFRIEDVENMAAKRGIHMDAAIKQVGIDRAVLNSIIDMARSALAAAQRKLRSA